MRAAILLLAAAAAAACGDDATPPPNCTELGCEVALCNRAGECVCTPPGLDEPVACTAAVRR